MIVNNENKNDRVVMYLSFGVITHLMDLVLYMLMYFKNILMDPDASVIYHNRWGQEFGCGGIEGVEFRKIINDYQTERITGLRLAGNSSTIETLEFQVDGVWTGPFGRKNRKCKEIILTDDEYFNRIKISGCDYVKFITNCENSIEAGNHTEEQDSVIMEGNFKLMDCKGIYSETEVQTLRFLWHKT
eukprot:45026_1